VAFDLPGLDHGGVGDETVGGAGQEDGEREEGEGVDEGEEEEVDEGPDGRAEVGGEGAGGPEEGEAGEEVVG